MRILEQCRSSLPALAFTAKCGACLVNKLQIHVFYTPSLSSSSYMIHCCEGKSNLWWYNTIYFHKKKMHSFTKYIQKLECHPTISSEVLGHPRVNKLQIHVFYTLSLSSLGNITFCCARDWCLSEEWRPYWGPLCEHRSVVYNWFQWGPHFYPHDAESRQPDRSSFSSLVVTSERSEWSSY